MPKSCCVVGCTNHKAKRPSLRFFCLPQKNLERRQLWLQAIKREGPNKKLWDPASPHTYVCGEHFVTGRKDENPGSVDYIPSVFPVIVKTDTGTITLPVMRNQKTRETSWRADVRATPGQTVADPCKSTTGSAGILAKRAPAVKKEDVIEVTVGETGEKTHTTDVSESPETFGIEGRYTSGTWEQATVEAIMSLRLLGTTVTTTQVAQTIIANLKDENDFLRVQNANMEAELKAKQWMHEQEVRDLQERLETLEQKCSCGTMSEKTDTASEMALSDVMVAKIKTEPDVCEWDLQGNSIY
ncbi:THAP domain-containing protein 11-like [Sardina pilchardus]|uniref:THAP domain-containing protein 11-like n=1 Tax=Sardina pilchardus TaxID=27697 RepID=UPI002E10E2A7